MAMFPNSTTYYNQYENFILFHFVLHFIIVLYIAFYFILVFYSFETGSHSVVEAGLELAVCHQAQENF